MKRILAVLLIALVLLNCVGCQQAPEPHICYFSCFHCGRCTVEGCSEEVCAEKCQGHHFCESRCRTCNLCTDESCLEAACAKKCDGHHVCIYSCPTCELCLQSSCEDKRCIEKCQGHKEEPYQFPTADYFITTEPVVIDTGTFVYHIPENVYVRGDLEEITNIIVPIMERVSGLTFAGNGYGREDYPDGKIHLTVTREGLGTDEYGAPHSELGPLSPYADPVAHVQNLSPGDLFVGNSTVAVHETAHMLMLRQSPWSHCELMDESISTYTEYLVAKELEEMNLSGVFCLEDSIEAADTYTINNKYYDVLFDKPLEYWLENSFEDGWNGNYSIGFRFAAYLHEVYGSYTKWVTEFENMYGFRNSSSYVKNSTVEQQLEVLKAAYGEDVLDGFYPWLKKNLKRFEYDDKSFSDLTNTKGINLYPHFNGIESRVRVSNIAYEDLYINLETVRDYVEDYKKLDTSPLTLIFGDNWYAPDKDTKPPIQINLYRADGSYTTVVDGMEDEFSLEGISYIKLVGSGTLSFLYVNGPFTWVKEY